MMNHISPVSMNAAGGSANILETTDRSMSAGTVQPGSASPTTAAGVLTGSQSITNVFSSVSAMMQAIGGGLENDRLLRLLIAALLIMALLQQQQQEQRQSGGDELQQLGNGADNRSSYIGIFSSSTTITFQQTTTMIGFGMDTAGHFEATDQTLPTSGNQVDLSA